MHKRFIALTVALAIAFTFAAHAFAASWSS